MAPFNVNCDFWFRKGSVYFCSISVKQRMTSNTSWRTLLESSPTKSVLRSSVIVTIATDWIASSTSDSLSPSTSSKILSPKYGPPGAGIHRKMYLVVLRYVGGITYLLFPYFPIYFFCWLPLLRYRAHIYKSSIWIIIWFRSPCMKQAVARMIFLSQAPVLL